MSTWPQRAREVTPEESAEARVWRRDDRIAYADPEPVTYAEHYAGQHFRKAYGLWLEGGMNQRACYWCGSTSHDGSQCPARPKK